MDFGTAKRALDRPGCTLARSLGLPHVETMMNTRAVKTARNAA